MALRHIKTKRSLKDCLLYTSLQSGGSVFQFPLLGFVVCGHFHETLITDFPVYIVLIQPLDVVGKFCNAALHLSLIHISIPVATMVNR